MVYGRSMVATAEVLHVLVDDGGEWVVAEDPAPTAPLSRHRDASTAVRAATVELKRRRAAHAEVLLHDRYHHVRVASRLGRRVTPSPR